MSAWTDLVKQVYNENKSKPGYKLGDAMKEARLLYKKGSPETRVKKAKRSKKNKTSKKK